MDGSMFETVTNNRTSCGKIKYFVLRSIYLYLYAKWDKKL